MAIRELEIHLEEQGKQSWLATAFGAWGGTAGFGQFRFVARSADGIDAETTVARSTAFPLLRFTDPDAIPEPHPETDTAEMLAKLHRDLVAKGWHRQETPGRYWWSRTYEKVS